MSELDGFFMDRWSRARVLGRECPAQQASKVFALVAADQDEPPRSELAVVRNAALRSSGCVASPRARARADELARLPRAPSLEQRQDR
jgi:hypothetical protein